ncbi:MAG: hypothetical protein NTY77_08345 [Elusimicrobia bacterium]|nr:hypothetical protein [Elusimicrobiota bacterium]
MITYPETTELGAIWTDRQYAKIKNTLEGERVSLGVEGQFNSADGSLAVTGVLPGSRAEKVLHPLDRILKGFLVDQDEKVVAELARLPIQDRLASDDAILTAISILLRDRRKSSAPAPG